MLAVNEVGYHIQWRYHMRRCHIKFVQRYTIRSVEHLKPPTLRLYYPFFHSSLIDLHKILLQQPISMTEPSNPSTDSNDNDSEWEDTSTENQSVSNAATEDQSLASSASTRNWFLLLPPEIRLMVYSYVLHSPIHLPYNLPMLRANSAVQSITSILRTCRYIRAEGVIVFYRENTFFIRTWHPRFTPLPSEQIGNMIQNLTVQIRRAELYRYPHHEFMTIVHAFEDPAIIRGTLTVYYFLCPPGPYPYLWRRPTHIRELRRFTNFRVVEVEIAYSSDYHPSSQATQMHRDRVESALRFVLGPARPSPHRNGLTFLPQQFLNAQRP